VNTLKEPGKAYCHYCGDPVSHRTDYQKVTGWVKSRAQGGTNALRGREEHDEWACRWCVDKLAKGVSPQQGGMF
jgi:hypothetical protein